MNEILDITIVGAGITGITLSRLLHRQNELKWLLIDKGRSVGGRMATRRIGELAFDHGAQFFTVRTTAFRNLVDSLIGNGIVNEWCRGFKGESGILAEDGFPRYAVPGGMNRLAKFIAQDLGDSNVTLNEKIIKIDFGGDHWRLHAESGKNWRTRSVVLTMPLPQTLALLEPLKNKIDFTDLLNQLSEVEYDPCVAVMGRFEFDSLDFLKVPYQFEGKSIAFLADNHTKSVSHMPGSLTIHLGAQASQKVYEWEDNETLNFTMKELEKVLPGVTWKRPLLWQVHRWKYAKPKKSVAQDFLEWTPRINGVGKKMKPTLLIAGEVFGASRVESAFLSGRAVGERILDQYV